MSILIRNILKIIKYKFKIKYKTKEPSIKYSVISQTKIQQATWISTDTSPPGYT